MLPRSDGHPTFVADKDKRNSQTFFSPHPDSFKPCIPPIPNSAIRKWQSRIPSLSAKRDSSVSYSQQQQWGPFGVWYISIKQSIKKTRELMWVTAYLTSCVLAHWEKRIGEISWQHHSTRLIVQEATPFPLGEGCSACRTNQVLANVITGSWFGLLLTQLKWKSVIKKKRKEKYFMQVPTLNDGLLPSSPFLLIQVLLNCLKKGPNQLHPACRLIASRGWISGRVKFTKGPSFRCPW